jgi:hypothetical protein
LNSQARETHSGMHESPTTPSRRGGMLDIGETSPALQAMTSKALASDEKPLAKANQEGSSTPSLLSRLFSWGTPSSAEKEVCFFKLYFVLE